MKTRRAVEYRDHFFLEVRESDAQSWQLKSRDNDREVMNIRFEYAAEHLRAGESVRLTDALGAVLSLKEL